MFKIPFSNLNSELELNPNFINFFAYFEVKNGIIFAYIWHGESRAVAAWTGARVEIEKAH